MKVSGLLLLLGVTACQAENTKKAIAPQESESADLKAGLPPKGEPESPVLDDNTESSEELQEGEQAPEGSLEVVSRDLLPTRISVCVDQGVAGSVVDGLFQCTSQSLVECSRLSQAQNFVASSYVESNLVGYNLYACSQAESGNPILHFYAEESMDTLQIFNLEIQGGLAEE